MIELQLRSALCQGKNRADVPRRGSSEDASALNVNNSNRPQPVFNIALTKTAMGVQPQIDKPMQLVAALGAETLNYGAFKDKVLITYRTVLSVESFLPTVVGQLSAGTLRDPTALAYMLRTLAKEDAYIREDPQVRPPLIFLASRQREGAAASQASSFHDGCACAGAEGCRATPEE